MNKGLFAACILAAMAAGAQAQKNYEIGNPSKSDYAYLKDYANLKDYINYEKYPNFKLGIGTTVSEYNKKGDVYRRTNANFTETVAGNAMKMSSCVSSNGSMNFNTVTTYVNNATAAGINVYGHTLAWHSQQPIGWLSSLIKDKPAEPLKDGDVTINKTIATKNFTSDKTLGWHSDYAQYNYNITFDSTNGMKVTCTKKASQNYEVQYVAMDNIPVDKGTNVKMKITLKGSAAGSLTAKLGDFNSGPTTTVKFTKDWQDVEVEFKNAIGSSFLLLQSGSFVGDIYIKKVEFLNTVKGKTITEDRRCIIVNADAKVSDAWDNQFWILTGNFSKGAKFEFSADVRADVAAKASTQIHTTPGSYVHHTAVGDVNFTTEWKTIKSSGTFDAAGSSIAFNLNEFAGANKYYFDNVSLKINGKETIVNGDLEGTDVKSFKQKIARGSVTNVSIADQVSYVYVPTSTPLTAEEVHDTLVYAMDKWISGMMKACNGKVRAWDVVNEAISGGGNDGQGNYTLQHREGYSAGSNTWDVGGDAFYWQDYMGDLEYVRQAVRLARKYGPEDIKLFINDYNLESDWDQNKKLKSLINWIKKWESDGTTFIDGIGTQMHISYYENSSTQTSKKNAITNMFKLMAATGKLVRVSELDMGYVDKNGDKVPTTNMTEEGHKKMADFYKWIIQQYLKLIPPAQQWGICQWCPTDAAGALGTGWRGGEPVGWWDLSGYRKHAYAAVCEGLGGVNMTGIDDIEADNADEDADFLSGNKEKKVYDLQGRRVTNPSRGIYIINGKKVLVR